MKDKSRCYESSMAGCTRSDGRNSDNETVNVPALLSGRMLFSDAVSQCIEPNLPLRSMSEKFGIIKKENMKAEIRSLSLDSKNRWTSSLAPRISARTSESKPRPCISAAAVVGGHFSQMGNVGQQKSPLMTGMMKSCKKIEWIGSDDSKDKC